MLNVGAWATNHQSFGAEPKKEEKTKTTLEILPHLLIIKVSNHDNDHIDQQLTTDTVWLDQ